MFGRDKVGFGVRLAASHQDPASLSSQHHTSHGHQVSIHENQWFLIAEQGKLLVSLVLDSSCYEVGQRGVALGVFQYVLVLLLLTQTFYFSRRLDKRSASSCKFSYHK